MATTFTWRACSGGLSLGDTDNDGVFELYQGDRDMDYRDGGYGKGVKSYWADDLTERWIRLDDLTSSQAPVLADVNGDGIKDVITGMYGVQWVLDSSNGEVIEFWSDNDMSVHYGTTVYDIDGDGNLELLVMMETMIMIHTLMFLIWLQVKWMHSLTICRWRLEMESISC